MPAHSSAYSSPVDFKDIGMLIFPDREVLGSPEKIAQRRLSLERAVIMGNSIKGKTRLVFEDETGLRQIDTFIWGLTDKRVILKQGTIIPINRIHEVML